MQAKTQIKMKVVKTAKLLEFLSYVGLLATVVYYFFVGFKSIEYVAFALLIVCILRMVGASLKASFFEKEYTKLKEDNEFMQRRINELQKTEQQQKE